MKHRNAGFTLIEILVVLVIIAIVVSMATINTSHDGRYDDIKIESEKLKFILTSAADEALFQNKNIGLAFSKTEIIPYSLEKKVVAANSASAATSSSAVSTPEFEWKPYESRHLKSYSLPDSYFFELRLEGQEVSLPYALKKEPDQIQPNAILSASGEQTPLDINVFIEAFSGSAHIRGDGLGRYYSEVIREEE